MSVYKTMVWITIDMILYIISIVDWHPSVWLACAFFVEELLPFPGPRIANFLPSGVNRSQSWLGRIQIRPSDLNIFCHVINNHAWLDLVVVQSHYMHADR